MRLPAGAAAAPLDCRALLLLHLPAMAPLGSRACRTASLSQLAPPSALTLLPSLAARLCTGARLQRPRRLLSV